MKRTLVAELMDDPNIDPATHRQALAGLARLNAVSDRGRVLLPYLKQATAKAGRSLRLLDVATGAGDGLLPLLHRSRKWRFPLLGLGCDVSATAIKEARKRAKLMDISAEFFGCDVLHETLPTGSDYVLSSLFFHHLHDDQIQTLLKTMQAAAGRGILVNDLRRSRVNRALVWGATRLLSRSSVVHFDGPISVSAALTPSELLAAAHQAGLTTATVKTHTPCRMVLHWERS